MRYSKVLLKTKHVCLQHMQLISFIWVTLLSLCKRVKYQLSEHSMSFKTMNNSNKLWRFTTNNTTWDCHRKIKLKLHLSVPQLKKCKKNLCSKWICQHWNDRFQRLFKVGHKCFLKIFQQHKQHRNLKLRNKRRLLLYKRMSQLLRTV